MALGFSPPFHHLPLPTHECAQFSQGRCSFLVQQYPAVLAVQSTELDKLWTRFLLALKNLVSLVAEERTLDFLKVFVCENQLICDAVKTQREGRE